jgi:glycine/D-amino acid oxidase-like deaminating enzyme
VVGAGVVGAACAATFAAAGLSVCVIDRDGPAAGSSSSGEGNLLVSDKLPGPELDLALHSIARWRAFAERAPVPFEYEAKGGLVVARSAPSLTALGATVEAQRAAGVEASMVASDGLAAYEPMLAPDLPGGAFYPQDAQVQPMLAVRALLVEAAAATVVGGCELLGADRDAWGALSAVRTSRGTVATPNVVIAAGALSADAGARLGVAVPVVPRRGHVLVTEPLPPLVRHKVYEAGYVCDVESDAAGLLSSAVVEGTGSGPILLGSSRELVGFDRRFDLRAAAMIARGATALFPFLRAVRMIRGYLGFRPASPDHLPIIGAAAPGVWLATGHEGAGVGLAMGTADLLSSLLLDEAPAVDPAPFDPARLAHG